MARGDRGWGREQETRGTRTGMGRETGVGRENGLREDWGGDGIWAARETIEVKGTWGGEGRRRPGEGEPG